VNGLALTTSQFPQVLTWGETTAYILNPDGAMGTPEPNEASVVVLLKHGNMKFLFTGDIDYAIEATVVARNTPVAAEVLKVAHHGSIYSSEWSFLNDVNPDEAVISVGENTYGHPAPEVIANLELIGARVWRTDQQGTILMYSDGITVTVVSPTPGALVDGYLPLLFKSLPPFRLGYHFCIRHFFGHLTIRVLRHAFAPPPCTLNYWRKLSHYYSHRGCLPARELEGRSPCPLY
jgi:competence protein ComEC